jgi:steroid delta-isomerase-like uncharacterized protein
MKYMSTPSLVESFYADVWNSGDISAVHRLLAEDFSFRGSLGADLRGREAFMDYVRSVRNSLADYRCEILECVTEGNRAFARMRFSGLHTGLFRGHAATGKPVHWMGAALFRFENPSQNYWLWETLRGSMSF